MKHNFVMTSRKDWIAQNGYEGLSDHSSDPSEKEEDDTKTSSEDEALEQDTTEQVQTNDTLLVWTEDKEHALMMLELLNSRAGIGANPHELWQLREEKRKATAPSPDDEADYERMVRVLKEEGIWDKTVIIHIVSQNASGIGFPIPKNREKE